MHNTHRRLFLMFCVLALIAGLAGRPPAAPAAEADGITPLFLGSLTGSTSTEPGPPDTLFSALANAANTSIDVALYELDRASVRDALVAAKGRGVTVRVVGDNEIYTDTADKPFYDSLMTAGIPIILDNRSSLQHNKFAIFDKRTVWTGSANFTNTAFTRNGENVVVVNSVAVAQIYTTEFEEMFKDGKFSTSKTDNIAVHDAGVGTAQVTVAFAPTDQIEQRIIDAIAGANTSIQVAMFAFTNAAIGQALIAAHQRGVRVEVLLEGRNDGSAFTQRIPLCAAGVTVRVEDWPGTLHNKYAVIDADTSSDPTVITGSVNWTANAVAANDENMLIVRDDALARAFAADYARLKAALGPQAFVCVPAAPDPGPRILVPLVLREPAAAPAPTPSPTPSPTPTPTQGAHISFIEYDPPGNDVEGEYVLIRNDGTSSLDLSGWTLRDLADTVFTFPAFTLVAGAELRVWTRAGNNDAANLYWGRGQAIWNNGGDTAILRNAQGNEVSRYTYP